MKITKEQLNKIIKEEVQAVLSEGGAMGHYEGLSDAAKVEFREFIEAWFNQAAARYRNDPTSPYKAEQLARDLMMGAKGKKQDPYSASVDFNFMVKNLDPADQDAARNLLSSMAKGVEKNPALATSSKELLSNSGL